MCILYLPSYSALNFVPSKIISPAYEQYVMSASKRRVVIESDTMNSIISYCMMQHPDEAVLIARGRSKDGTITVSSLVIPPFGAAPADTFGGFPHSFLPLDQSYMGTIRSHPEGGDGPTPAVLHAFFGLVSLIIKHPYEPADISAWDSGGRQLELTVLDNQD